MPEKWEAMEKQESGDDPLNMWHEEGGMESSGFYDEYLEDITEEEERVIENDPANQFVPSEEISSGANLDTFLPNAEPWLKEDLEDGFENEDFLWGPLAEKARAKRKAEMEKKKGEIEIPYSLDEFRLMEKAYKYKGLSGGKEPKGGRPSFKGGELLTDKQIMEQVSAYKEYKENKAEQKDYSDFDVGFMSKCARWNYANKEIARAKATPEFADGKVLNEEQIDELIGEYKELREKNPQAFAELKVLNGEWYKNNFNWRENEHKGNKQWQSYKSKEEKGPGGKKVKKKTKYVVKEIPADTKPENVKRSYYSLNSKFKVNDELTIRFIKLKPPFK